MMNRHFTKHTVVIVIAVLMVLIIACLLLFETAGKPGYYKAMQTKFSDKDHNTATITRDIQYCDSNISAQQLDLFVPTNRPNGAVPVVIYVHGGGWYSGDRQNDIEQEFAPQFVAKGIAFATVDYRLSTEAVYPAQNSDVHCAVSYLVTNAAQYHLNANSMGIMGDSAGGQLAAMEVLGTNSKERIKAAAILYGVTDLWDQMTNYNDDNAKKYLGTASSDKTVADAASPMYADLTNAPPFLIIHGTTDTVVPAIDSEKFYQKLIASGNDAQYIAVKGANHAFIGGDGKDERKIRNDVVTFFEKYLK